MTETYTTRGPLAAFLTTFVLLAGIPGAAAGEVLVTFQTTFTANSARAETLDNNLAVGLVDCPGGAVDASAVNVPKVATNPSLDPDRLLGRFAAIDDVAIRGIRAPVLTGASCFDLKSFDQLDIVVDVSAQASTASVAAGSVSLFVGFDDDGDGCVGCSSNDRAFQSDSGHVRVTTGNVEGEHGTTFVVFVRAVSAEATFGEQARLDTNSAVTGTLTVRVESDEGNQDPCNEPGTPEGHCGEPVDQGGYPYGHA